MTIQTQVRNPVAAGSACRRLELEQPVHGEAELFSGKATGLIVQFPDWRYPTVFDTESGQARYDTYEGRWGDRVHLDRFLQMYAVKAAKIEARRKGHSCTEQQLDNGSIKLTVNVGGAA